MPDSEKNVEKSKSILVIEDDREISAAVQSVLTAAGYRVIAASNGQDGRRLIQSSRPDLVLTDMMMPRMGGFPVLEFLSEMTDPPPVIMMTANEGSRHKAYAEMLGVAITFASHSLWKYFWSPSRVLWKPADAMTPQAPSETPKFLSDIHHTTGKTS